MIRLTMSSVVAAAMLMCANSSWAQGDFVALGETSRSLTAERQHLVEDLHDPAFNLYVSPRAIGRAVATGDPGALTDVALQLAEGERVLLRSRRGFTAQQVLQLALNAATQKHDKAALERIGKFATAHDLKPIATQAATALKLANGSRTLDPDLMIPIDTVNVEDFVQMKVLLQYVNQAKLTGDSRLLIALEADADTCIPDPFRPQFDKLIQDARSCIPENYKPDERFVAAIDRLVQVARDTTDEENNVDESASYPTDVTGDY